MTIPMLKGIHRRMLGISKDDQVVGANGFVAGGEGKPAIVFPSPDTVAIFDDFLGDLIADEWNYVDGDTGNSAAILAGTNGIYQLKLSATQANATPNNGNGINSGVLNWKANQGPGVSGRLRMSARIRLPQVPTHGTATGLGSIFVGFTDSVSAESPIYDTGAAGGPLSNAADAVGFIFGPRGDTGWVAVSAKSTAGDSGDQIDVLGTTPVSNRWTVLEVEVNRGISDTGGVATFYIDGKVKGRIVSPVASTVALTPAIHLSAIANDTGTNRLQIDWVNVSAPRDTGQ